MNPDGSQQQAITTDAGSEDFPSWSPDGRQIAFLRGSTITIMNADGTNLTPLIGVNPFTLVGFPREHFNIDWSPDGSWLTFNDGTDIKMMRTNGSDLTNLTDGKFFNYSPAWSPNGTKIVFERSSSFNGQYVKLFTVNRDGTDVRILTTTPAFTESRSADWSPDGSKLVYATAAGVTEPNGLAIIRMDGTGFENLLPYAEPEPGAPKWSPDGAKVVFHRFHSSSLETQIWAMDRQGGIPTQLTFVPGNNFRPDWQPLTSVSISGRVTGPGGAGIRSARVMITNPNGYRQTVTTSSFGYYSFAEVPVGASYTVGVESRRYRFAPQTLTINDFLTGIDFVGQE
ncbi:MAG: carboxypeptidase regulatory-like domain-containing protein [Pyrinomonadaceae bacterium]